MLLLFAGVGLVAARESASTAEGASSPEAAAAGLLTALGDQDLDKAGQYLDAEERLLLDTYRDRVTALLAGRMTGPSGQPLSGLQLTARDIRFQRVAGLGGADVAVVELAGGTVGGRDAKGAKLELPAAELNRRLADQSKGAITGPAGRRCPRRRPLAGLPARLGGRAGPPGRRGRRARLGPARQHRPAGGPGAASPEEAVRDLVDAAGRGQQAALELLSPAERRILAAYRPLLDRQGGMPRLGTVQVEGLQLRTEEVADGVARVRATAGRLAGGTPRESLNLEEATAKGQAPYVVAIRQDGTWYPSVVFTMTDWMLHQAERERP